MGKKKIVIDTNNLISALGWEGNSKELFMRVIDKEYDFIISMKQLRELKRVLDYPKFKFTEEQKKKFLEIIIEVANVIETKKEIKVVEDKDDNMIIECAVEGNVDYIISGDDDLLSLKEFGKIKIITVKEFLEINSTDNEDKVKSPKSGYIEKLNNIKKQKGMKFKSIDDLRDSVEEVKSSK